MTKKKNNCPKQHLLEQKVYSLLHEAQGTDNQSWVHPPGSPWTFSLLSVAELIIQPRKGLTCRGGDVHLSLSSRPLALISLFRGRGPSVASTETSPRTHRAHMFRSQNAPLRDSPSGARFPWLYDSALYSSSEALRGCLVHNHFSLRKCWLKGNLRQKYHM